MKSFIQRAFGDIKRILIYSIAETHYVSPIFNLVYSFSIYRIHRCFVNKNRTFLSCHAVINKIF